VRQYQIKMESKELVEIIKPFFLLGSLLIGIMFLVLYQIIAYVNGKNMFAILLGIGALILIFVSWRLVHQFEIFKED